MRYIFALLAFTNPTWAACLMDEEIFMSCRIEDSSKILRVCFNQQTAYYRFGLPDALPELELKEPIETLSYTPWPGVGRSIWEAVHFENDGYSYEVHGGFERMFGEEEYEDIPNRSFGGVYVTRGDEIIQDLDCDRETVDFGWDTALGEAKNNLGYEWSFEARDWVAVSD